MSSDALGLRLVRSLLEEQSLGELTKQNVSGSDLLHDAKKAFEWVMDYLAKNGSWPTVKITEENVKITFNTTVDPLNYIADTVRKRSLSRHIESGMEEAIKCITDRDPDKAVSVLQAAVLTRNLQSGTTREVKSYADRSKDRATGYETRHTTGGLLGIPTPWKKLDDLLMGWVNGELIVVIAMQNTGKSWWLCVVADHLRKQGKKVLFLTLEMAAERIETRLDAIALKMPFSKMRKADFNPTELALVKSGLDALSAGPGDILVVDKILARTVADLNALVVQHKPDIVLVDGGYRFESPGKDNGNWESTKKIVADLQYSAESSAIPWIVTTQYGDADETGKTPKKGPKMRAWGVRYGKEWVINPDVALGLYADEDIRLLEQMEICPMKLRDAGDDDRSPFRINWNTEKMMFDQVAGAVMSATSASSTVVEYD
jgi:hypothetical protein